MTKVLLIGNNEKHRVCLRSALEGRIAGGEVGAVQASPEALVTVQGQRPDIVLIDATLASKEGFEICRCVKEDEKTRNIPVVLLVGKRAGPRVRAEAYEKRADGILSVPCDDEELATLVMTLLKEKQFRDSVIGEMDALSDMLEHKERELQARTHDLQNRVRELDCLYSISELREREGISLEEVLQGVAEIIPRQYPEITCARILLGYQEFRTKNYRGTAWRRSCDIVMQGEWVGTLEVYYSEDPGDDSGTHIRKERFLLRAICERLGRIAERVQAESALRLESENLMNILKSMEDGVYKINEQFDLEYVNPALVYEFGTFTGRKCYEYFHDRNGICPNCRSKEVFDGKTVRREWQFPKRQRTYDIIDTPLRNPDGSVSSLSILRDLTDIKRAQRALEERELLYRSVTESAADGAVMVQDGKILFANHALVEMFGYRDPEELSGREVVKLFDPDFRGLFQKVFDSEEQDKDLENLVRGMCVSRGGRKFWVSTNRRVIRLKSKPAILATMRDITEDIQQESSIQDITEHLKRENIKLRSAIKERYRFGNIIGKSLPMQNVYEMILQAAGSSANVLLLGESGTGKELVARAIHEMSPRSSKAFVPVNCGAIPENLVESEFFGHRKGAFTGAHIDKTGYLHTASGGTLFLDEVGELSLNIQVKLLRALESGEYVPVGDTHPRRSRLRIISATNRDFRGLVDAGRVREDFYYRISVIPILLPTLREKKEDIPLLIDHFLRLYGREKGVPAIPGKISEVLYSYDWPGNVRELQSVVQRFLAVGNWDFLTMGGKLRRPGDKVDLDPAKRVTDLRKAKETFERRCILEALQQNRWHKGKAAAALRIDPKTLYIKMKKIGLF
ncbi:MAG: sigma 54-interacting transcriptional regulator [Deltaproteobacteria bacterium]|nr:sigma 54-interacting transcriptional regulator [Deltaproteobacteria bacterium]